ncbi:MAG TPA: hypothetical protein VFX16_03550 [Pseudonocardiaceae bacterium]|nr:hypothetical protein [Pseudonocardiaceae bacterium]
MLVCAVAVAALFSPAVDASAATATQNPGGSLFTAVTPQRVEDTRIDHRRIAAESGFSIELPPTVPDDATAVVLNATGTGATAPTFLSVTPVNRINFVVSTLNLVAHETRANLVTVALNPGSADGHSVFLSAGGAALDAIIDLEGYYTPNTGAGFTSMTPKRVLDTRIGLGIAGKVGAGKTVTLDLSSSVPVGTTAVVFNLTGTDATGSSFVTAWRAGSTRPGVSNLNIVAGATTPNMVTVAVGADREVNLFNSVGTIDLVADLAGFYSPTSTQAYFPLLPIRVLDTRNADETPREPIVAGGTIALRLRGWLPATATTAVFNLTAANVTGATFLTAWPAGAARPTASNLNLVPHQVSANLAIVALGGGNLIDLFNHVGRVDAIVDLAGYFAPLIAPCVANCVSAFGDNLMGQLGNGSTSIDDAPPADVYGLSDVVAVSGTGENGFALRSDGTVWSWGDSTALGNASNGVADTPTFPDGHFSTVPVQVIGLTDVVAIDGPLALKADGTVWAWGANIMWQLGDNNKDDTAIASVPVQVTGLTGVTAIAYSVGSSYALRSDGTVWSWGQNTFGELGNGTSGDPNTCVADQSISPDGPNCASAVPVQVSGLTGVTAIGIRLAAKADGTVWRWGGNPDMTHGQSNTPILMPGLTGVTQFANSAETYYALLNDGTVRSWGVGLKGSLGNGVDCGLDECNTDTPTTVVGLSGVKAIAGASNTGYALLSDGTVDAWGGGQNGELGDGQEFSFTDTPVPVPGLTGVSAIGGDGYAVVPTP